MGEVIVLAADSAEHLGRTVGFLAIPVIGLVLLVVGLVQRSKSTQALRNAHPPGGYPPPQNAYPQVPQYGGYPQAPPVYAPTPPKPAGKGLIIAGAVILVLGMLGALGSIGAAASGSSGLEVGDCITNESFVAVDFDAEPVACNETKGVYELVTKGDGDASCPDGKREDSGYAVLINKKNTLCFIVNFFEGECYVVDPGTSKVAPTACTAGTGRVKIVKREDGTSDESVCEPGQYATSFPEPARVYCFEPA